MPPPSGKASPPPLFSSYLEEAEGSQPAGSALLVLTAEDVEPLVAVSKLVGLGERKWAVPCLILCPAAMGAVKYPRTIQMCRQNRPGSSRWGSKAIPQTRPDQTRPGLSTHLDTEAEVCRHPIELAALGHHIRVRLIHIGHVLQVPRVLGIMRKQDLVQVGPISALVSHQVRRF